MKPMVKSLGEAFSNGSRWWNLSLCRARGCFDPVRNVTYVTLRHETDSDKESSAHETLNCSLQRPSRLLRATILVRLRGGLQGFGEHRRIRVRTLLRTEPRFRSGFGQRLSFRLLFGAIAGVLLPQFFLACLLPLYEVSTIAGLPELV